MKLLPLRLLIATSLLTIAAMACERRQPPAPQGAANDADSSRAAEGTATRPAEPGSALDETTDTPAEGSLALKTTDGRFDLNYIALPTGDVPLNAPFKMVVLVAPVEQSGSGEFALSVDAAMPEHGHGMNVEPQVTALGKGRFSVEGMLFHMPGRWELYFDITRDGVTSRAQDEITLE
jgi:hypothetical protein